MILPKERAYQFTRARETGAFDFGIKASHGIALENMVKLIVE